MKAWKHILYLCVALGMLVYAAPQLSVGQGFNGASLFGVVWICFALLVIAAQLHELLGVDGEKRERLRQVKRMRHYRLQETTARLAARHSGRRS